MSDRTDTTKLPTEMSPEEWAAARDNMLARHPEPLRYGHHRPSCRDRAMRERTGMDGAWPVSASASRPENRGRTSADGAR